MSSEFISSSCGYLAGYFSPTLGTSVASAIAAFTISFHSRLIDKKPAVIDERFAKVFGYSMTDAFNTGTSALTAFLLNKTFTEFKSSKPSSGAVYGVAAITNMTFSFLISATARNFLQRIK